MKSVKECIDQDDPLTKEIAKFLIDYAEEDDRLDYKMTLDFESEKEWLSITKDISAFANTNGGYLVFGVDDSTKKVVGLKRPIADTLKEVNNIHQKINRHLEPSVISLRAKEFKIEGFAVVVIYIPQSKGVTHLISKDGVFKLPSGTPKTIFFKGTFYVRRSSSNHLGDSRDLTDLIERRVDQFREALIGKVAKIVNSPASSEVFILSEDKEDKEAQRFIIEDSPDSIPIKGMSFTVSPEGPEEEIAAWSVICKGNSESLPSPVVLWRWYENRRNISVSEKHRLNIFQFSLWLEAPSLYWVKDIKAAKIRGAIFNAIRYRPNNTKLDDIIETSGFLGRATYHKALHLLGDAKSKLKNSLHAYPQGGAENAFIEIRKAKNDKEVVFSRQLAKELDEIAGSVNKTGKEPGLHKRWRAIKIDRYLYVSRNNYK